jgi:hypothetical protein
MFFYLKVSCKDKRILKKFLHFFAKIEFLPIFLKTFSKHEERKFVTVLKSPHVNKTAQEQFEYRFYSKHLLIRSFKPLTFLLFLKNLRNLSFSGINLEVKGLFKKNNMHKYALKIISPDNLVLNNSDSLHLSKKRFKATEQGKIIKIISKSQKSDFLLSKKYIQLFDLYGEICLKKILRS